MSALLNGVVEVIMIKVIKIATESLDIHSLPL